jgi:hypothetical protein
MNVIEQNERQNDNIIILKFRIYKNTSIMINRVFQILLLLTIFTISTEAGEDSYFKFRIYKDFIKEIFEKNLKMLFERTEKIQLKDIPIIELET